MNFRITATFTDSLARLTGDEQNAVKTTAFDLQMNPANPGMSLHQLDKARHRNEQPSSSVMHRHAVPELPGLAWPTSNLNGISEFMLSR